jgi:hypothetical protein
MPTLAGAALGGVPQGAPAAAAAARTAHLVLEGQHAAVGVLDDVDLRRGSFAGAQRHVACERDKSKHNKSHSGMADDAASSAPLH